MEVRQTASLYSEFQNLLKQGQVKEISIRDNTIRGELKQALPDGRQKFVTTRVDPGLARDLAQFDVKFTGVTRAPFCATSCPGCCLPWCSSASGCSR